MAWFARPATCKLSCQCLDARPTLSIISEYRVYLVDLSIALCRILLQGIADFLVFPINSHRPNICLGIRGIVNVDTSNRPVSSPVLRRFVIMRIVKFQMFFRSWISRQRNRTWGRLRKDSTQNACVFLFVYSLQLSLETSSHLLGINSMQGVENRVARICVCFTTPTQR